MTLLEAVVAIVILGVAGVASLGVLQTASSGARDADVWTQAVATAEAAMEASKLPPAAQAARSGSTAERSSTVTRRPWPESPGLEEVTVTVQLADGGEFVLHRLERVP